MDGCALSATELTGGREREKAAEDDVWIESQRAVRPMSFISPINGEDLPEAGAGAQSGLHVAGAPGFGGALPGSTAASTCDSVSISALISSPGLLVETCLCLRSASRSVGQTEVMNVARAPQTRVQALPFDRSRRQSTQSLLKTSPFLHFLHSMHDTVTRCKSKSISCVKTVRQCHRTPMKSVWRLAAAERNEWFFCHPIPQPSRSKRKEGQRRRRRRLAISRAIIGL